MNAAADRIAELEAVIDEGGRPIVWAKSTSRIPASFRAARNLPISRR